MLSKKILICDDHTLFSASLSEMLKNRGFEVTTVTESTACIQLLNEGQFDVFLCDLNIDQKTGFEIFKIVKSNLTQTRVFLLTAYYDIFLEEKALKMGFNGYLTKDSTIKDIITAIELKKNAPFYSTLKKSAKNTKLESSKEFSIQKIKLSKQEKEIIKWIVKGKTSKEIGETLFITKATVDTHRRNINRKLELKTIGSLIQFAHENNLID